MDQAIRFCRFEGRRVAYATIGQGPLLVFGVRLSSRDLSSPPSVESEARLLGTVLSACGDGPATIFACSCAGLATAMFARDNPDLVRNVVFFGGYAARDDIPEPT